MNNFKKDFYLDQAGSRKVNGIYCPSFDRWLLVDEYDFCITMEAADVLSSKVASVVYVFPNVTGMTSRNCLEYSISNKTEEKRSGAPDLMISQIPSLRVLRPGVRVVHAGLPQGFEGPRAKGVLSALKTYAEYVLDKMYVIQLAGLMTNHEENMEFSRKFFAPDFLRFLSKSRKEKSSQGLARQMKQILYVSDCAEDAERGIERLLQRQNGASFQFVEVYRRGMNGG